SATASIAARSRSSSTSTTSWITDRLRWRRSGPRWSRRSSRSRSRLRLRSAAPWPRTARRRPASQHVLELHRDRLLGQIETRVGDAVPRARLALFEQPVDLLARPALDGLPVQRDDHVEPVEPGLVGRRADQDLAGDDLGADQREQGAEARDPVALGEAPAGLEIERVPWVVERAAEALEHAVADVARDLPAA